MKYTRQNLMKMAREMNEDWNIFDLIYYWAECGCEDMFQLFKDMSKRDCLWVMHACFDEYGEGQYENSVLNKIHRAVYAVLAERV